MALDARSLGSQQSLVGSLLDWLAQKATNPQPHPITQVMPSFMTMGRDIGNSFYNMADRTKQALGGTMYGPQDAGPMLHDTLNVTALGGAPTALAAGGRAALPAAAFYSQLGHAVENAPLTKAPGSQWLGTVKNMPGVKPEELDWTGFQTWLNNHPGALTKQEAQDYLGQNAVNVQEVMKGGGSDWKPNPDPNGPPFIAGPGYQDTTKFSQYQLPGGENYRELLLTLPAKAREKPNINIDPNLPLAERQRIMAENEGKYSSPNFQSGHFDEPNVLAHVRFNDRYVPYTREEYSAKIRSQKPFDERGKKTLFLEEVQSDWHQKGRKEGYAARGDTRPNRISDMTDEEFANALDNNNAIINDSLGKVPDAPFKTTWPDLAMKRMIKYAADNGYDQIAWTPGKVQAERYDLSKQVSSVMARNNGDGTFDLGVKLPGQGARDAFMQDIGGRDLRRVPADKMDEIVGKDLADKIRAENSGDIVSGDGKSRAYSGVDLRVGGEGMNAFYDKMLPSVANKLGKKYGAKVGVTKIQTHGEGPTGYRGSTPVTEPPVNQEVWSLPITDAMRKEVGAKGLPLFSGGPGAFLSAAGMGQQK